MVEQRLVQVTNVTESAAITRSAAGLLTSLQLAGSFGSGDLRSAGVRGRETRAQREDALGAGLPTSPPVDCSVGGGEIGAKPWLDARGRVRGRETRAQRCRETRAQRALRTARTRAQRVRVELF